MPEFSYTVIDESGNRRNGVCQSRDLASAAESLRMSNFLILEIRKRSRFSLEMLKEKLSTDKISSSTFMGRLRMVTNQDIIQFFQDLELMLKAGLPLMHTLEIYRRQCGKPAFANAVDRIVERLHGGSSFSASLAAEKKYFSPLVSQMVATGEATGELGTMLNRIADRLEHQAELRNTLLTSLAYPVLILFITAGVICFLIIHVIPKFMAVLKNRNIPLPSSTQLLVNISEFLNEYWQHLLGGLVGAVFTVMIMYVTRRGRYIIDRVLLSLPFIGGMLRLAVMAGFAKTMSTLLTSGVSILDSLKLLSDCTSNSAFKQCINGASKGILDGKQLSKSLRARFIPSMLSELMSVGEETGTLDNVLGRAGDFFETKLRKRVKIMSNMFEPLLILLVGGVVGFVYISFFQVLYQMSMR